MNGCATSNDPLNDMESFDLVVEIDSEKKVWRNTFGNEPIKSCYLPGNVKTGVTKDLSSGEEIKIGYVQLRDKLIIETLPGWCDTGSQVELRKQDGFYKGILYSRSFGGLKEIGVAVEAE